MPRVPLRYLVTFSSEDPRHTAENLLNANSDGTKKWLSAPGDRTGRLEGVFQLEQACTISNIDVGTYYTFSVQISVGRSCWPAAREYCALVPTTTFMTPMECRSGKNKNGLKMFNKEHFCAEAANGKWDRIKVVCTQPFRKDTQQGLSILSVKTDDKLENSPSELQQSFGSPRTETKSESVTQTPSHIQKHFFGKTLTCSPSPSKKNSEQLQTSLAMIGASTDGGSVEEARFSRNTKLVMAAANITGTPKYKPVSTEHSPAAVQSPSVNSLKPQTKFRIPFDKEVANFLSGVNVADFDIDNFTFADLRHRFEKQKIRKLSKEERKIFFKMSQDHVQSVFDAKDSGKPEAQTNQVVVNLETTVPTATPSSKKHLLMERMQNVMARRNKMNGLTTVKESPQNNGPCVVTSRVDESLVFSKPTFPNHDSHTSQSTIVIVPVKNPAQSGMSGLEAVSSNLDSEAIQGAHDRDESNKGAKPKTISKKCPSLDVINLESSTETIHRSPVIHQQFDKEVAIFLSAVHVAELEVENFTFADLRHRFEKQNLQKLSKEERKIFFKMSQEHVQSVFDEKYSGKVTAQTKQLSCSTETTSSTTTQSSKEHLLMDRMQNVMAKRNKVNGLTALKDSPQNNGPCVVTARIGKSLTPSKHTFPSRGSHISQSGTQAGLAGLEAASPNCNSGMNHGSKTDISKQCPLLGVITESSTDKSPSVLTPPSESVASHLAEFSSPNPGTGKRKTSEKSADTQGKPENPRKRKRNSGKISADSQSAPKKSRKKCPNLHVLSFDSSSDEDTGTSVRRDSGPKAGPSKCGKSPGPSRGHGARGRGAAKHPNGTQDVQNAHVETAAREQYLGNQTTSTPRSKSAQACSALAAQPPEVDISVIQEMEYDVMQNFVQCPICNCMYAKQSIENHAARCRLDVTNDSDTDVEAAVNDTRIQDTGLVNQTTGLEEGECPICGSTFPQYLLADHANICANLQESNMATNNW